MQYKILSFVNLFKANKKEHLMAQSRCSFLFYLVFVTKENLMAQSRLPYQ